jgi:hypothetical protein
VSSDVARSELRPPVVKGRWLRPSESGPAEPRWGHPDGLQVGIDPGPVRAPRGLLRIYAPYLDQRRERLLNFVAVEPIPVRSTERGFSELEHSELDGVQGKRFWSADRPDDPTPLDPTRPAQGVVSVVDGVETLTVYVLVEPFANGADVHVRVTFRADRPHEVALAAYRRTTSVELSACVLTATMGSFARLRRLRLRDREVSSAEIWPGFAGPEFTEHAAFGLDALDRDVDGSVVVTAVPDEEDPTTATHEPGTAEHWRYVGRRAVQGWRAADPRPDLVAQVNGRAAYWASRHPIPGGVSFENFELVEEFRDGRELVFFVDPLD